MHRLGRRCSEQLCDADVDDLTNCVKEKARTLSDSFCDKMKSITTYLGRPESDDKPKTAGRKDRDYLTVPSVAIPSRGSGPRQSKLDIVSMGQCNRNRDRHQQARRSSLPFNLRTASTERARSPTEVENRPATQINKGNLNSTNVSDKGGSIRELERKPHCRVSRSNQTGSSVAVINKQDDGDARRSARSVPWPMPDEHSIDKEGKLFLSTEYSSDDKALFVFITQCGNIPRLSRVARPRLSFCQIYFGKKSKKKVRKLKIDPDALDYRYSHTYSIRFKSFDHMNYSGIAVQIQLKYGGVFEASTIVRTKRVKLHEVEMDPAFREETLFY